MWNGNGYFKGLKGDNILIELRIIVIVDIYDVIISERSYCKVLLKEFVVEELKRNLGI